MVCNSCAEEIGDDHVVCQGFCNAAFHFKCCGLSENLRNEVASRNQLFWLCVSCSKLMSDLRCRRSIRSAYDVGIEYNVARHSEAIELLKEEILCELRTEIRSSFATLVNSRSCTPIVPRQVIPNAGTTRGRRLFKEKRPKPVNAAPAVPATGNSVSPSTIGVVADSRKDPKFWLYLSRLSRHTTVDQVSALVKSRLGIDDVDVVRLVGKGQDVSKMAFISFRVGMKLELKDTALNPSIWPKGILLREFINMERGVRLDIESVDLLTPTAMSVHDKTE